MLREFVHTHYDDDDSLFYFSLSFIIYLIFLSYLLIKYLKVKCNNKFIINHTNFCKYFFLIKKYQLHYAVHRSVQTGNISELSMNRCDNVVTHL